MLPCQIAYAIDAQGLPVLPIAAKRFKRSSVAHGYQCPECMAPVQRFAEMGGKQMPHFRHVASNAHTTACCFAGGGGESEIHRRACHSVKARLLEVLLATADASLEINESISAGQPLLARSVRRRPVVLRGQLIEALMQDGTLSIRLKVEALSDGLPGQMIRVRNPKTKREFYAKIKNDQTVLLSL